MVEFADITLDGHPRLRIIEVEWIITLWWKEPQIVEVTLLPERGRERVIGWRILDIDTLSALAQNNGHGSTAAREWSSSLIRHHNVVRAFGAHRLRKSLLRSLWCVFAHVPDKSVSLFNSRAQYIELQNTNLLLTTSGDAGNLSGSHSHCALNHPAHKYDANTYFATSVDNLAGGILRGYVDVHRTVYVMNNRSVKQQEVKHTPQTAG